MVLLGGRLISRVFPVFSQLTEKTRALIQARHKRVYTRAK
nr:MAG TPA: hypothetical protein [Caudoviricetes sp.]